MSFEPTTSDETTRDSVLASLKAAIQAERRILLPAYDPDKSLASDVALQTVGIEPNAYGGRVGEFRYQFEGEEDLLHLIITRVDCNQLSVEEGQRVFSWILPTVNPAEIWLKAGVKTQHFFLAHDILVDI